MPKSVPPLLETQLEQLKLLDLDGVIQWLQSATAVFDWMGNPQLAQFIGIDLHQVFFLPMTQMTGRLTAVRDQVKAGKPGQADSILAGVKETLDSLHRIQNLPVPTSPEALLCKALSKQGPIVAAGAYLRFTNTRLRGQESQLAVGFVEAKMLQLGIDSAAPIERTALESLRTEFGSLLVSTKRDASALFESVNSDAEVMAESFREWTEKTTSQAQSQEASFQESLAATKADLAALKITYETHMKLQAPVGYWIKQRRAHWITASVSLIVFIVCCGAAIWAGVEWVPEFLLKQASDAMVKGVASSPIDTQVNPPLWRLGVLVAIATVALWAMRLLARFVLGQAHSAMDASQRVTMTQTYLALSKDGGMAELGSKELVLNALFRKSATGLIKDDGVPSTPLGLLQNLVK